MIGGVLRGTEFILHPRFEVDRVLNDIHKKRPTIFPGVPTMYTAMLHHPEIDRFDFSSLKACFSGGAPLPVEVMTRVEEMASCRVVEGYGLTETAPACISNPWSGVRKPGSIGLPLPGTDVEIRDVDDPDKLLGVGESGEICVIGGQVTRGYWKKPEETANAIRGGRLHTGDVGYMDEDGYVFLVDRKKDMIISGGYNVFPRNIEEAIWEHPAVAEVTVIGIPDEYRGQAAKAFVKLKEGATLDFDELKAFLADKLGKHEMPAEMELRDELPKTAVGKLSKKELVAEELAKREATTKETAAQ
jgi:long-chain acyl-CoA synthetase